MIILQREPSMILEPHGREFYKLAIVTEPAVSTWQASFDGGATWKPSTVVGDALGWLVAGSAVDPGSAVAVISANTTPLLRAVDTSEVIVREGPKIFVQ